MGETEEDTQHGELDLVSKAPRSYNAFHRVSQDQVCHCFTV